uniref:Putative secreted protein n=1 Tax=Ixodes ricinus TaxID=34613 RepID=A0A147BCA1_IXORI
MISDLRYKALLVLLDYLYGIVASPTIGLKVNRGIDSSSTNLEPKFTERADCTLMIMTQSFFLFFFFRGSKIGLLRELPAQISCLMSLKPRHSYMFFCCCFVLFLSTSRTALHGRCHGFDIGAMSRLLGYR